MAIYYNREVLNLPKTSIKYYNKVKHRKQKISRKVSTQRITAENKRFLKSLGLKLLV